MHSLVDNNYDTKDSTYIDPDTECATPAALESKRKDWSDWKGIQVDFGIKWVPISNYY